jgi:hypothetical protein
MNSDVWNEMAPIVALAVVVLLAGALVPLFLRLGRKPPAMRPVVRGMGEGAADAGDLGGLSILTRYGVPPLEALPRGRVITRGGAPSLDIAFEPVFLEYHREALQEAKAQYWFSVIAATAGFAFIIYEVSRGGGSVTATEQLLKTLPGVVVEVISALYFRQSTEIRKHATEFFDRLRSDHQIAIAVEVLSTVQDETMQSDARVRLALHLVGADAPSSAPTGGSSEGDASITAASGPPQGGGPSPTLVGGGAPNPDPASPNPASGAKPKLPPGVTEVI